MEKKLTPEQEKYLTYLVALRDFKESYKQHIMGFEHKGKLDWKTYEQFRDSVVESFPEEGVQIGKYKAVLHGKELKPMRDGEGAYTYFVAKRKSIVLHKFEPKTKKEK